MTDLLAALLDAVPLWSVYVVIFLVPFLESLILFGFLFPGETVLILAGILAGTGDVTLVGAIVLGILGAVLGDNAGYLIGRRYGKAIQGSRLGRLVGEERWRAADDLLVRRGAAAVFIGRYLPFVRTMVPGAAGMAGLPQRTFFAWNLLAGVSWVLVSVIAGWTLGTVASTLLSGLGSAILLLVALAAIVYYVRRARQRRAAT